VLDFEAIMLVQNVTNILKSALLYNGLVRVVYDRGKV